MNMGDTAIMRPSGEGKWQLRRRAAEPNDADLILEDFLAYA